MSIRHRLLVRVLCVLVVICCMTPAGAQEEKETPAQRIASNLRLLGQVLYMYANEHKGALPDHPIDVAPIYASIADLLVAPGVTLPEDFRHWPIAEQRDWIDDNGVYTYVAKGKKVTSRWGHAPDGHGVVAYQSEPEKEDGLAAALFRDGHVERLPMEKIKQLVP